MKEKHGVIYLPTHSAAMIWLTELLGQFSDGMWENSRPHDHWMFWNGLEVEVVTAEGSIAPWITTKTPWTCTKSSYALKNLIPIVGDRMLKQGRLGRAANTFSQDLANAADYMPETLEEFRASKEGQIPWVYKHVAEYMECVSLELAEKYYATEYTMKDLKRDLDVIKAAMKLMKDQ